MAFVPGHQNDIFISYSHTDNEPTITDRPGWVDFFEDVLRKRLRVRLRMQQEPELEIFRDTQLRRFGKFPDQLAQNISSSAVFVCLLSPGYFGSEWCLRELREFTRRGGSDRIIKVVKTAFDEPNSDSEAASLYEQIKDILDCRFYKEDESTGLLKDLQPEVIPADVPEFLEKIDVVAQNLVVLLQRLRTSQLSANTASSSAVETVTADPAQVTVYLAETTRDLQQAREEVRTELLQFNCRVLPDVPLSADADVLTDTVRAYQEQAKLSVHLLGPNYGVVPELEERSIPHLQYDLGHAISSKGNVSQLVWMPNHIEKIDPRQLRLIESIKNNGTELLSSRIEDLKTEIRKKLNADSKNPWGDDADEGSVNVSLFCHEVDMPSVGPLYSYLTVGQLFRVKLPLKDADSFQTHKELLQTSDAVILYYGTADEDWFVNIWRLIQRQISSGRNKPVLAKAIYAGKPSTTEKTLLESDDPIIIKNFGPFTPQSLTPFIERIKDGRGGAQ